MFLRGLKLLWVQFFSYSVNFYKGTFYRDNKVLLLCCLFFVVSYGELILIPKVGDTFLEEYGGAYRGEDSSSLLHFLDSTGYVFSVDDSVDDLGNSRSLQIIESPQRLRLSRLSFSIDGDTSEIMLDQWYSALLVEEIVTAKLNGLAENGHPYGTLGITIVRNGLVVEVEAKGSKGPFVASVDIEVVSPKPVRSWLLLRPLLFDTATVYNHALINASEEKLSRQSYVKSAQFLPPEIVGDGDTVTAVLPLLYEPRKSLLFDGVIGYQSEGEYSVTGRVRLSLNNVIGFGESFGFSYAGEGYWQRATLEVAVPYLFGSPFAVGINGEIEVASGGGGFGNVSFRIGYDVLGQWQVGFGGRYYEVSDSVDRKQYGGITVDMRRYHGSFARSKYDWTTDLMVSSGFKSGEHQALFQGSLDFSALFHIPFRSFAYVGGLRVGAIATAQGDTLADLEKFRLGGYATVRGYGEEQYPAVGFLLNRSSLRWYFSEGGALYSFIDNAGVVKSESDWGSGDWLMGYGMGIVVPLKALSASIEWARHRQEVGGLGRLHFSLSN